MRILAIHSANHPDQSKRSAVDKWRLADPLAELRKHTDWQIDEQLTLIPDIESYKSAAEFTEAEMEAAFKRITDYDVVISTYQSNPTFFTLLQVARDRFGTQYIMDVDDDLFAINPHNPVWLAISHENAYMMQRMVAANPWISTTTPALAEAIRKRRDAPADSVFIRPNYISDEYQHPPFDNGNRINIGFFGGSSHHADLHNTGVLEALQRLMHNHKNVYFKSIGMPIDAYLPRQRITVVDGKKGDAWLNDIYPNMNLDIAIAPLEDNPFNRGKSNIKWQEATRAGSLFVASDIGPYAELPQTVLWRTKNSVSDWYDVLERAVADETKRRITVSIAQQSLKANYRLEDHWQVHKQMFEMVGTASPRLN